MAMSLDNDTVTVTVANKVTTRRDGEIFIVTLNRPDVRNAVDPEAAQLLVDAFTEFEEDPMMKVAILQGEGPSFCGGYDLKAFSENGIPTSYEADGRGPLGISRMFLSKPVIGVIQGYAVAGGFELSLWCDLRVAEEDAKFGVFCRRWGVPLIDGGTVRLPRLVGMSHALDMILTGRPVGAQEALGWGLANRVVPQGQGRAAALELARQIAAFPQICMRADRLSAYQQEHLEYTEALKQEGRIGHEAFEVEARNGASRFAAGAGRGGSFDL
jgi:enoyl-CoA hydratase